jgi:hypothetical protein
MGRGFGDSKINICLRFFEVCFVEKSSLLIFSVFFKGQHFCEIDKTIVLGFISAHL